MSYKVYFFQESLRIGFKYLKQDYIYNKNYQN